jgi:hypothetical protein
MLILLFADLLAIAVMRFIVHRDDVLEPHQLRHDSLEHLAFSLGGPKVRPAAFE